MASSRWFFLFKFLFLTISLMLSIPVWASSAEEHFSTAQKLFQDGRYNDALQRFEQAQKAGMQGNAIIYNLAVTRYKLGHYKQAGALFHRLLDDPSMRPLAALNLGLVEDKLNHPQQAVAWFRQAYEQKTDKKISLLAWQALAQMGVKLKKPFEPETSVDLSMSLGLDSNVVDPVNPASNISDSFLELYMGMEHSFSDTLAVSAMLLSQDYSLANNYDFQLLGVNLDKSFTMGNWSNSARGMFNTSNLAGTEYQTTIGAQLQAEKSVSKTDNLRLRYRYQQISSADRPWLAGWRMKLRAEQVAKSSGNRLRYELELNDRVDSNYAPTRHTLRYYYRQKLTENWGLNSYVGFRYSDYSAVSRTDTRLRAMLRFKRPLGKTTSLLAEYSYTNNNSNVASYSYNRNLVSLGFQALF